MDLLTWEGIRNLATCEALNLGSSLAIVPSDPSRPVIKWRHQRPWAARLPAVAPTAGACVYARAAWRHPWRAQLIQQIREPVVLLTTFYDHTIKDHATAEMFQPGSLVRHWFGVQAMTTHPRLTAMPVGVEGSMVPHLEVGDRRQTRDIGLYLNFQIAHNFQRVGTLRADLWQHFSGQPWVTTDPWGRSGVTRYIQQLGRAKFVLSPPGFGWDCYRTYEAIAMGAIPIVQRKRPITDVCEALPVLLVDDWSEVTWARLQREWETRPGRDTRTMTLGYWRDRIRARAGDCVAT